MKKTLITIVAFGAMMFSNELSAQFESGSKFIGGAFGISSSGSKATFGGKTYKGETTSSFTLMPSVGYFIGDNLAVGMGIGYTSTKTTDPEEKDNFSQSSMISFNPFARYYVISEEKFGVFGQFSLPVGLGKEKDSYVDTEYDFDANFNLVEREVTYTTEYNYTSIAPGVSAGFTFLPTSKIALEGSLGVLSLNSTSYDGGSSSNFNFGLNLNSVNWSIIYFF